MTEKMRWGVISTAKIAREHVIPAMQRSQLAEVHGIASRSLDAAHQMAADLGIPKAYGSYEEMLADPEIEAVYNPLPNHLHVPVSLMALEAGKHVLCEKPIAMSSAEAEQLVAARDKAGKLVAEAFMVRHHPQWQRARELVRSGKIGRLVAISTVFSYMNRDPENMSAIFGMADIGGGGLMDIGCYALVDRALYLRQ